MSFQLPDWLRRAIRTFVQAAIAIGLLMFTAAYTAPGVLPPVETLQRIGIAMLVSGVIATLTAAQNWVEDNTRAPALLKAPPSPGRNPEPEPVRRS